MSHDTKKNVPAVRFAGFEGEWNNRILGDIGHARSGVGFPDAEQGGTEGTPFYKVSDMNSDANENEMQKANNYVTAEQIRARGWKPVEEVPAIFFAKVGAAVMLNRKRLCRIPFLMDNNTMAYCLSREIWKADFAKSLFETIDLTLLVQIGALPSYNGRDVESMHVMIPENEEQSRIGQFFRALDKLIELRQKKLERLILLKKQLLNKLFPRQGRKIPDIRFAGFEGEWERREFKECFYFLNNNTLSRACLTSEEEGNVQNIHYGDILIKFDAIIDVAKERIPHIQPQFTSTSLKNDYLRDGDVIIADTAEDSTVGKCSELVNIGDVKVVSGLHTMPCRPQILFGKCYLGYYLNSRAFHEQLIPLMQGIKVTSVSKGAITNTQVSCPREEEQTRIGQFFQTLDKLIELRQRELEKQRALKRALLREMFV